MDTGHICLLNLVLKKNGLRHLQQPRKMESFCVKMSYLSKIMLNCLSDSDTIIIRNSKKG